MKETGKSPQIFSLSTYYLVRGASALLAVLPVRFSYAFAGWIGTIYCRVRPSHSRWAAYNYARVLHEPESSPVVQRMARRAFANYAKVLVDFFRLPYVTIEDIQHHATVTGIEHLVTAAEGGKGLIVVTAHMGSWDRSGALITAAGFHATVLVDTFSPPQLDAWVTKMRAKFGLTAVPVEKPGALREMYRTLKRGDALVFVIDRPDYNTGVPVTFFGERTGFPAGVAQVALRTGCGLALGGMFRRPGDLTYDGFIELIVPPARTGDMAYDVQALTQAIVTRLEEQIVTHPDQWYMFRPMWPVPQTA